MQFQVPQFIETEDKIVGPLSLRQFAYLGAGGILSALLYFFTQTWLWAIGSVIIFSIVIAFAFVKIQGRPFANVLISAFHFYWKPQTYVWQPEHPVAALAKEKAETEAGKSALEEILSRAAGARANVRGKIDAMRTNTARPATHLAAEIEAKPVEKQPISRETVKAGSALHKSWEDVQTGAAFAKKNSDKQFLDKKMSERYQIFRQIAGDRNAAKRVDYR
jgi:hypothetical protein